MGEAAAPSPELGALYAAASAGIVARAVLHDLNNVLGCIVAVTTPGPCDDPSLCHRLATIRDAVTWAAAMLRELEAPRRAVARADVRAAIASTAALIAPVAARARVAVAIELEAPVAPVALIAHELHQVVLNLGLNAIDAMADTGGALAFGAVAAERDGRAGVAVTVADTGPGLPTGLEQAIRPGWSTKVGHGGLGLAVVAGLVARAGGRVDAHSAAGRGTTFAIWLPAAEVAP